MKLGELHQREEEGDRDAVHVPVVVVRAGTILKPGERVCLQDGKRAVPGRVWVGIVDPFLAREVYPDEYVALLVPPKSINELRHEWTSEQFPSAQALAFAESLRETTPEESGSEDDGCNAMSCGPDV